jgi:hypothetical protein
MSLTGRRSPLFRASLARCQCLGGAPRSGACAGRRDNGHGGWPNSGRTLWSAGVRLLCGGGVLSVPPGVWLVELSRR